jgi:hypothetical protein
MAVAVVLVESQAGAVLAAQPTFNLTAIFGNLTQNSTGMPDLCCLMKQQIII